MKIFIDTNIMFSSILHPGSTPDIAFQKALSFPNICFTSVYCIDELSRKFKQKFPEMEEDLNVFLSFLNIDVQVISESESINELEKLIRDPKDRPVLRAAIECGSEILITGDKDLLESSITYPEIMSAYDFINKK